MSSTKLIFFLQDLHHGWWQAVLSDGAQQATIRASFITGGPLLDLLWTVRLLLLGANESTCSWLVEPGRYRWRLVHTEKQVQIRIIWFDDTRDWSDEKGETILCIECDLLAFAKRLSQQLSQLEHRGDDSGVPLQEYQKLKEAITAFEQARPNTQRE